MRQKRINTFKRWLQCVKTESNKYDTDRYIVTWKKRKDYKYGLIQGKELIEIDGAILSNEHKANAVKIDYPKLLKKALQDPLTNQFQSAYDEEVKKYNNINRIISSI